MMLTESEYNKQLKSPKLGLMKPNPDILMAHPARVGCSQGYCLRCSHEAATCSNWARIIGKEPLLEKDLVV